MSDDYLKRYIFNHVEFYLVFLVPFLFISCQDKEWNPNIIKNPSTYRTKNNLENEKIAAKDFITKFINSYLKEVDSIVVPRFRDSLYISGNKKYKARLITSSESESYLFLAPSDANELIIDFTDFPAQLALVLHLDIFGDNKLS